MRRAWRGPLGGVIALAAVSVLSMALASSGCKRRPTDELAQESARGPVSLPPLALTDDTPDLLITWVDAKGNAHAVSRPPDVPTEGRDRVRVVLTTKEDGAGDVFYVANLTTKNPDGAYPVTTMPRQEWESLLLKRRQASAPPGEPPIDPSADEAPAGSAPAAKPNPPSGFTVIVYGAEWCGACHEAVAYLKKRRVPVVEKDIEQDPAAAKEMQTKLARAGAHGGSIPVIDVKGKILIGFEPHALEAAVRGASAVAL